MKIALFAEGPSEEKTILTFARKILGKQASIISRVKRRGDLLNKGKIYSYIINDIFQEHSDVSKIIVCVDSECTSPQEIEERILGVEETIMSEVKRPIYYIVVVHALEGWLLADPQSIKEYLGPRAKVNISASATSECRPKEVMSNIFNQAGKEFLYTRDNPRIAEKVNVNKLARRSKSFAEFMKRIKDP